YFFFFSSRRRHTRFSRDWSSDVCSSDLGCTRCLVELQRQPVAHACHLDRVARPERLFEQRGAQRAGQQALDRAAQRARPVRRIRSEEHTSELQSRENLVCRLLLEKKKRI